MKQLLLFPDPRPLVERLGADFFRHAPEFAGVYLMRDAAERVLYVGKAKNLRKRLGSYRVANPARLGRRHLRLLQAVTRIELQQCADETEALAREAALLRTLRPRFNRAGTWPGLPRFVAWRVTAAGLELAVTTAIQLGWDFHGPLGGAALPLRAALARLLWCALHRDRGVTLVPEGWFDSWNGRTITIPRHIPDTGELDAAAMRLASLFAGDAVGFVAWVRQRTEGLNNPFEVAVRDGDLLETTSAI